MKKLGVLSVFLLILISIVLAVNSFDIGPINMSEDTTTTINLNDQIYNNPTGVTWTWTGNVHIIVTKSQNVITFAPQANWNGQETITFTATSTTNPGDVYTDPDGTTVTVNSVNDVPTYSPSIPSPQVWNAGTDKTLNLSTYFHDADGDTLTYTWTPATLDDIDVSIPTGSSIATFHPRDSKFIGENTIQFTASDPSTAYVSSANITLRVEPNICDSGKIGKLVVEIKKTRFW